MLDLVNPCHDANIIALHQVVTRASLQGKDKLQLNHHPWTPKMTYLFPLFSNTVVTWHATIVSILGRKTSIVFIQDVHHAFHVKITWCNIIARIYHHDHDATISLCVVDKELLLLHHILWLTINMALHTKLSVVLQHLKMCLQQQLLMAIIILRHWIHLVKSCLHLFFHNFSNQTIIIVVIRHQKVLLTISSCHHLSHHLLLLWHRHHQHHHLFYAQRLLFHLQHQSNPPFFFHLWDHSIASHSPIRRRPLTTINSLALSAK